jgi:hypothetical protein
MGDPLVLEFLGVPIVLGISSCCSFYPVHQHRVKLALYNVVVADLAFPQVNAPVATAWR